MAYTFGGAATDDIVWVTALNLGADNTQSYVCGWFYPTTLTAGRGYWSAGNTFGAEVDTTTSEIRMRTDNTTDGQWVTSGAGIVTDKWHFIAWLNAAENTTVAGAWRVWVGTIDTAPVAVTVTNPTTRSGNYTGSTNFYAGNKGTGSLAFEGDIDWLFAATVNSAAINSAFGIGTSGAIAVTEATLVEERWVIPMWQGRPDLSRMTAINGGSSFFCAFYPLNEPGAIASQWSHSTAPASRVAPAISGATFSDRCGPVRCLPRDLVHQRQLVLGARR